MPLAKQRDLSTEIASHREFLFRLALLQLREKAAAEDATQDALIAALQSQHKFDGRSSLKTWMVSILRFKIIDVMRVKKRHGTSLSQDQLDRELDLKSFEGLFDETGCWATPKAEWTDPQAHVERVEFMQILEACLTRLPENTSRVFLMREWLEFTSKEVCAEHAISPGNLRVLLYRARMQLRRCLDDNWMGGTDGEA